MSSSLLRRVLVLGASTGRALAFAPRTPLAPARMFATRRGEAFAMASPLEEQIKSTVAESKVVIYSKSWCPFCAQTKALFDAMDVPYTAIELDELDNGGEIQDALTTFSKQRTVPNVFVGGEHVGGNDDTQRAAKSGKLTEMLQ